METLFQLFEGVIIIDLYDILGLGLIFMNDHLKNLKAVLEKLQSSGLRLNKSKCLFTKQSVEYLGHIIGYIPQKTKFEET